MSEWISVKDRLPEKNGKYLVCVDGGKIIPRYVITCWYWNGKFEDFQHYTTRFVSFWMPLPEPPEVDKT